MAIPTIRCVSRAAIKARLYILFVIILVVCGSSRAQTPHYHIQLEEHHVNIDLERNRFTSFKYAEVDTNVSTAYEKLTNPPTKRPTEKDCNNTLKIDLTAFGFPQVTLCLFKDQWDPKLFSQDATITIFKEKYTPPSLCNKTKCVTGYVKSNPQSKVTGYLINGNFYGQIRLFDKLRLHHVILYVEPGENLKNYVPEGGGDHRRRRRKRGAGNSIVFENIARVNENGPPTMESSDDTENDTSKVTEKPNRTENSQGANDDNSKGNATETKRKKRQTKDQEQYSYENKINVDKDVIHSFKFKKGITAHSIFDTSKDESYICELCIWIQPHFAKKFALGGSTHTGTAEVIDLIRFLNWIFRTQDFDQDGAPDGLGFVIKSILLTDEVSVTGQGDQTKDDSNFSQDINTIKPSAALAKATKQITHIFKSCCASLAFIYHNLAPAISATNHRGLCTNKNVAVVSGLYLSNKIGKYDVFRGAFHAMGHLFGGHHDDVTNIRCIARPKVRFINPFVMHPVNQLNVGVRPGSLRMSSCSKDHITQFLASTAVHCLQPASKESFCGNGFVEDNEECDCGSLWQCHLNKECCGESDTVYGCKHLSPSESQCSRPRIW